MSPFIEHYFAWAGPNTIAALATATAAWWLLTRGQTRHVQHYLITAGAPVIAVALISAAAAAAGIEPFGLTNLIGILAGVIGALLLRPRIL